MSVKQESRHVLLTGSVPLSSAEEVFLTVADTLGERAKWVPDGETGERINWIGFQIPRLLALPEFELVPTTDRDYTEDLPTVRLKEGVKPEGLKIGNLGYADAAKDSFKVFDRLQKEGRIPRSWKFQVSLPTPLATVAGFVHPSHQNAVEPAYEKQILNELREIADSIPHDRLAIQWDVAVEFAVLEGVFPVQFDNIKQAINERLIRLGSAVPEDIDLGYHLCYGDYKHHHFFEPKDTSKLVAVANAVAEGVKRPIQWLHLPVPRSRTDDAYFRPLRNLALHPETELFLGLVHKTDGEEGTLRRIETAQKVVQGFGVATECGLGRRPAETIPDLLRIHARVAEGGAAAGATSAAASARSR
jgi:hypothetical protein